MSYTTDEMARGVVSGFSTSSESQLPSKSFTNSRSIKFSTDSLNTKLKTIQTTPVNRGVHLSASKESYQNDLTTNNEITSTLYKSKSSKLIESTEVFLTHSTKSTDRNVNSKDDKFTKLMLQNDISSTSNIKEFSPSLKMVKERSASSQVISSLSTFPSIVAGSSFRDNTGETLESNNDLSTKTSLLKIQRFTVPVKPIETSATQIIPSKSTRSRDKIRFLDSTMQSTTTTMKKDSIPVPTTMPLTMVTNRNHASTFKLNSSPIHTKETQNHVSIFPSYKVSITTEAKLTSTILSKNRTKTRHLKGNIKRSTTLQKLNTESIEMHGNQMNRTTSHSLSPSTIMPQSTKHPAFILKPTGLYSFPSQAYTNDSQLGNTTEPIQTMGAGALVIVVLLPFLALFLIAVVTALRRKMKKSSRRERRYKNPDVENKIDRDQSQMVPLTKSEVIE